MWYVTFETETGRAVLRIKAPSRAWAIRFVKERYGWKTRVTSAVRIG